MKQTLTLCVALFATISIAATGIAAEYVVQAQGGPIRITPIFHASMQIEYRGHVIQVDPVSLGDYSHAKKADMILITHTHPDHLDKKAIAKVRGNYVHIVGPESVIDALAGTMSRPQGAFFPMKNDEVLDFDTKGQGYPAPFTLKISAVPMYNLKRGPKPGQKFHPKGEGNGYILTIGGKRIYIAGDTEVTPEMKALKNIDVAFLPMNLPYTMTPQEAAEGAKAFMPRVAIPYHYRYPFNKKNDNPYQFKAALQGTPIKVVILPWYPAKP